MNDSIATPSGDTKRPLLRRRYVRWAVRFAVLAATVVVLLVDTPLCVVVSASSALVASASSLATWAVQATAWIGLAVGAIALVRRRWFCRWVCPTGTCADTASQAGYRARRRCPRLPPVGQWIALITLGGAVLGYPVLLWLDPLALLSGAAGVAHEPSSTGFRYGALGVVAILLMSIIWPGIWCLRLCPLGGLQDILASLTRLPNRAMKRSADQPRSGEGLRLSRRVALGVLAGLGFSTATRSARASAPRPLRPPGAIDDERFVGVCIRCGNCLRACPTDIIRSDLGANGVASLLTPVLDFTSDYCHEDCTLCADVCPSGAITELALEAKPTTRIGLPQVDMSVCLLGEDRDCAACRTWCPYEAIKFVFCDDPDVYALVPQIDQDKCPGCGACEMACPTKPVKAIVVQRELE